MEKIWIRKMGDSYAVDSSWYRQMAVFHAFANFMRGNEMTDPYKSAEDYLMGVIAKSARQGIEVQRTEDRE